MKDKVVVITGGTDGIGKALVAQYLQKEYNVATCGRSEQKLSQLKKDHSDKPLLTLSCDVSREDDCKSFIDKTLEHFNRIDILINNAGISMHSLLRDVQPGIIKKVMDINFWGAVCCTKFALEALIESKGTIVGISSIAGYRGLPGRSGYSASKFALNGWLEAIRTELSPDGVNVMWVAPGFTRSNVRIAALTSNGSQQGASPLDESRLMSADQCAKKIIHAIEKKKRTLILTSQGKQTVIMNKLFPALTDKLVRKFFFKNNKLVK